MNREDILKMEAGRDIDELVTQKIFMTDGFWHGVKEYSTDISAAWEVVEKIAKEPIAFHLQTENVGENKRQFWVLFFDGEDLECSAEADTPSLAICRAALLAVVK